MRGRTLAVLALVGLLLAGCGADDGVDHNALTAPSPTTGQNDATGIPEAVTVHLRDVTIVAETAVTPEERGQGLSGRPSLAEGTGMLFFQQVERIPGFHMRDMQFPLDFVWIATDGTVADLTENVPHPELAGETLTGVSPSAPVLYVLEVNAGVVEAAGLEIGDQLRFDPDILALSPSDGR